MVEDKDVIGALLLPIPLGVGAFISSAGSSIIMDMLAGGPWVDSVPDAALATALQFAFAYGIGLAGFAVGGTAGNLMLLGSMGALVAGAALRRGQVSGSQPESVNEATTRAVEETGEKALQKVEETAQTVAPKATAAATGGSSQNYR